MPVNLIPTRFWNMLVYLIQAHFLFFLNFYRDVLLENPLAKLCWEILNGLGKSTRSHVGAVYTERALLQ